MPTAPMPSSGMPALTAEAAPASAGDTIGLATGGAQDIENFRWAAVLCWQVLAGPGNVGCLRA